MCLYLCSGCLCAVTVFVLWLSLCCDCLCNVIVFVLWLSLCCDCLCAVTVFVLWLFLCSDCLCCDCLCAVIMFVSVLRVVLGLFGVLLLVGTLYDVLVTQRDHRKEQANQRSWATTLQVKGKKPPFSFPRTQNRLQKKTVSKFNCFLLYIAIINVFRKFLHSYVWYFLFYIRRASETATLLLGLLQWEEDSAGEAVRRGPDGP